MHRDLKLPNILLHFPDLSKDQIESPAFDFKQFISNVDIVGKRGTKKAYPFVAKIADLGFARKVEEGQLAETKLGTPLLMAPEVLNGNKYDHSADVWSLGCIFYEMLTGYQPFTGTS